ncbi:MAG: hypothetical protein H7257_14605 [Taibaiella sp.]|nr:hypothetical protein [Taibaiella sp.]
MRKLCALLFVLLFSFVYRIQAQDESKLYYTLRNKIMTVKDYVAAVEMKIDVSYMKIPRLKGTLYYKNPDKMRLERAGGISLLPKKNINLTLSNLIPAGNVMVIDVGEAVTAGKKARILKVVPEDDLSNIVLTKIWVDEAEMLALRTETTTRNDGTVIMDLAFGKYSAYGLPDKVTIYMDLKDYKLPQGVTMDYNSQPATKVDDSKKGKSQKGTIQINYLNYEINKGIPDEKFKDKK